ncbi:MAG: aminodeoxychorismate/anthranilate synthase component II [Bacteroidota bacterium]
MNTNGHHAQPSQLTILVIDNYDSFTYNLVDILRRSGHDVQVRRNDEISLAEVEAMAPDGILISPGPGRPEDSGVSVDIVKALVGEMPILGVCLGHQLLGEMFGMALQHAGQPMHGKTSQVDHDAQGVFEGLPQPMRVMRYHSLLLANNPLPEGLTVTATSESGEVMGIRHKILNFAGVQFHPESVLTECGDQIIRNWICTLTKRTGTVPHSRVQQV